MVDALLNFHVGLLVAGVHGCQALPSFSSKSEIRKVVKKQAIAKLDKPRSHRCWLLNSCLEFISRYPLGCLSNNAEKMVYSDSVMPNNSL